MLLRIKPAEKTRFPLKGILVKGGSPSGWIIEIQQIGLSLSDITVYPLAGSVANTIWGCLVMFDMEKIKIEPGKNTCCQLVHQLLLIPERSNIFPSLSPEELEKLLQNKLHIYHPEFGLALLETPVNWHEALRLPENQLPTIRKPANGVFVPGKIKSLQVIALAPEKVLSGLEEKHFPDREKFENKPLNLFEKGKLFLYRQLFTKNGNPTGGANGNGKTPLLSAIESLRKLLSKAPDDWIARAEKEY